MSNEELLSTSYDCFWEFCHFRWNIALTQRMIVVSTPNGFEKMIERHAMEKNYIPREPVVDVVMKEHELKQRISNGNENLSQLIHDQQVLQLIPKKLLRKIPFNWKEYDEIFESNKRTSWVHRIYLNKLDKLRDDTVQFWRNQQIKQREARLRAKLNAILIEDDDEEQEEEVSFVKIIVSKENAIEIDDDDDEEMESKENVIEIDDDDDEEMESSKYHKFKHPRFKGRDDTINYYPQIDRGESDGIYKLRI